ncbi:porin family protein [Chitinophaga sp. 212800010-3]|uniref:porin family protein n=1 Tax=unclassified Chitinophaga TaxID=2619133 RepID=UPI002DF2BAFA|nr:OMP-b-brl-2 domain-containing protein [Chitinophaga sp. 212800010-3]
MNDEFENSIRNKLNEADIPFDQDAWTKMEALLDADNQPKTPVAWWWLMLLPILGGLVWWSIQSIGVNENNVEAVVQAPASPQSSRTDTMQLSKAPNHTDAGVVSRETTKTTKTGRQQATSNNKTVFVNQNNDTATIGRNKPADEQTVMSAGNNIHPGHTSGDDNIKEENKSVIRLPDNYTKTNNSQFTSIPVTIKDYNLNGYTKINKPYEIPVKTGITEDSTAKKNRRKINAKGLYFGVTLGPDLNVAPSFNYGKVGFNVGLLAHYYFNRHWFVTTGAVYSKKLYGATNKDYKTPGGSVNNDLVKVNADCDVLDIPVNLNYTFLERNNNTLSATLGISNYLMLKEKYQYIYKTYPDWEKTVENENQHYLAILNVGALYQHPAGKRLIVGVQPYAKIPLRGVGIGQVKLYSAGVSFQINLLGKKR